MKYSFSKFMKTPAKHFGLICFTAILCVLAYSPLPVTAEDKIYKFVDSNGVLHFTNVPISPNFQVYVGAIPEKHVNTKPTDAYDKLILMASKRHSVSFPLLKALIKVESDFNPKAVSKAGAVGLMQIMPFNFKKFKIDDPYNPWENVMGGSRYLRQLIDRFDGKVSLALAAYNAGPEAVVRYNHSVPPYPETERFVKKVMRYYRVIKKEQRG